MLLAVVCGFVWSAWRAEVRLADALPMTAEARDIEVSGSILGLPQINGLTLRFVMKVESASAPVPEYIQLSWYPPRSAGASAGVPDLRPGERWRLTVRLKRPHGFANPHGFDYEGWLLERNIRATGYVRTDDGNARLAEFVPGAINRLHATRDSIRQRFRDALPDGEQTGILIALAIGDQRAITEAQWEVFRRTGVAHLVSISGLHVSLVALLGGGLVCGLWRRVPWLALRWPAKKAGAVAGLASAAAYALLAGLGLPTQRALVMLATGAVAVMLGRESSPARVLSLALLLVLLIDPWAVLSAGFWLSFGAVGVIAFMLAGRTRRVSGWLAAAKIQLAITLATMPLLLALFNAFSLVAPIANALAIPIVSFVVTPLVLLSIVMPWPLLLDLAHGTAGLMMAWLTWLSGLPLAMHRAPAPPGLMIAGALVGVGWMLLPRGTPGKLAGLLAIVPLLLWSPERPEWGGFRATVLDVGQGLSVHLQTAGHDLLYDSGPPYGPGADAGSRVIIPYLTAIGVGRIHRMVLSHGDSDHVGGAASVIAAIPVDSIIADPEPQLARAFGAVTEVVACEQSRDWTWDGVRFEFLHPSEIAGPLRSRNDRSCVVRVSSVGGSLLLPGDIGVMAERGLIARAGDRLASDVVVAPHHGSRSSSSPAFVEAVGASHAIHAVGNINRFRHPHPDVWSRWHAAGTRNWRTDGQGAISIHVDGGGVTVGAERERAERYWHGR